MLKADKKDSGNEKKKKLILWYNWNKSEDVFQCQFGSQCRNIHACIKMILCQSFQFMQKMLTIKAFQKVMNKVFYKQH